MGGWKLRFVVLLTLTFHIDSKATSQQLVKTIGSKPDVTPLCTNDTLNVIMFIVCKISSERISGEECRLKYRHGGGFTHECDCRFTLMTDNHTVFLHLSRLTPEDSGNFTCECSRLDGTYVVHLNITVEEDEDASSSREMPFVDVVVGVLVFVVVTAVILGVICRKTHHRRLTGPVASHPHTEAENIEPYSSFMQRENVLYSTATFLSSRNTNTLNVLTRDDTSAEL
ncbi:uncharacterized protein LOC143316110 isoform X1 [Chaetodon auriga]|uniref:uncharacterized protein LOC143316110 isoform X1 n=1 Tax=Chaetodon auriga TaxID=39042 RepID=UPI004032EA7A